MISDDVLKILLADRTTGGNIVWATTDYYEHGCYSTQEIEFDEIKLICLRHEKVREHQKTRTRERAEIFTPSWLCNEQNNLVDTACFGRADVFNLVNFREHTWQATSDKIVFGGELTWQSYVEAKRLEVTCGEAPYLVSRYDTVSGDKIPIGNRIGLLDRKFRIVFENVAGDADCCEWLKRAVQSVYGYDLQGDNLFLARRNILLSVVEYYAENFSCEPSEEFLAEVAKIISWNVWQMDGLTNAIPYANINAQGTLGGFGAPVDLSEKIYCRIKDWVTGEEFEYRNLVKGAYQGKCSQKVSSTS